MIVTSSSTASGWTSGTGLAIAKANGVVAILRTPAANTAPGPDRPSSTSVPASTSSGVSRSPHLRTP
jgi:hypothetical protein